MTKLSKEAQNALLAAQNRPGSIVAGSDETLRELYDAGFTSKWDNTTNRGVIARQRILDARLDEAFG